MPIPNINAITSQLRMMPDQALQQYAAMHKSDPYILPMAIAESNSRKEMRAAQQAQATGQQQPKVADADIASMSPPPQMAPQGMPPQGGPQMAQRQLPEQQGIGALPAPNMQHMADGGIAGYADGGEFNYAGGSDGPLLNMAGGGVAHFDNGGLAGKYKTESMEMGEGTRVQYSPDVAAYAKQLSIAGQADNNAYADRERARMLQGPNGMPFTKKDKPIPFDPGRGDSWDNEPVSAFDPGRGDSWDNEPTDKKKGTDKKKSGDSNTNKKPAANANVIPPEAPATAEAPAKEAPTGADLITQAIAGSKALNDESAAAYKPWHEKLDKENEEISGRKADNRAYALLAAGLGMMGGTSQYAAQNIAAGGIKGLATFQEAEKADAAARKANQQSQMLLMQAERAERSGNMKVAGDMQSRAEQARQFGITSEQKAQEMKDTKAYHDGALANQRITANASMVAAQRPLGGGGAGMAESRFQLSALTKERDDIAKQLKENMALNMKAGAAEKAQLLARRNQLNAAIAQLSGAGTMDANSLSGSGSGVDMSQWGKSQVVKP